jgi:hypothetical protein
MIILFENNLWHLNCREEKHKQHVNLNKEKEKIMSHNQNFNAYIQPLYTTMQPVRNVMSTELSMALQVFLMNNPEFAGSQSHLKFLHYCLDHYINYDPEYRDLPLQEKLKYAGEMAKKFMGIIIGAEA